MALTIHKEEHDGYYELRARGEVDLYTSPELRKAILNALRTSKTLRLDLREVEYMDSSGVATLVEGLKSAGKAKQGFQLAAPSSAVMKVLQLSRLDSLFEIVPGDGA